MRAASAAVAGVATHEEQCREDTKARDHRRACSFGGRRGHSGGVREPTRGRRRRRGLARRHLSRRVGVVVRFHVRLRSRPASTRCRRSGSTPTCSCARSSATTTSPARRATCSCRISRRTSARSRTAGAPTPSRSSSGIRFGPPLEPRDHVARRGLRVPAHRHEVAGRAVRLLLRRDPRHGRVRVRQGQDHHRHRDPEQPHDRLPPHGAHRRLPLPPRNAGRGPGAARGRRLLCEGRCLWPLSDLLRPLHARRARTSSTPRTAPR